MGETERNQRREMVTKSTTIRKCKMRRDTKTAKLRQKIKKTERLKKERD